MSDFIMNLITVVIWLAVVVLAVMRVQENRGLLYTLTQLDDGILFAYKLGVYAGTVTVIRDISGLIREPQLSGNVLGWQCLFPVRYTNKEMCEYIRDYAPHADGGSHSKDLKIFNEVVNKNNNGLISVFGQIFVFDNRDFKPFNK